MWLLINFSDTATPEQIEDSAERYEQQLRPEDKVVIGIN